MMGTRTLQDITTFSNQTGAQVITAESVIIGQERFAKDPSLISGLITRVMAI